MTNDFTENIYRTLPHVENMNHNAIDENSLVTTDYPIPEEYLLDNDNSINSREWSVIDSATQKSRPPRQNEFLLLLLENPLYSSYISWIDKSEGLCKIHQPRKVAELWGKVKNRQTSGRMSYAIFARGIRFHYKSGLMIKTYKKHTIRFKLPIHPITVQSDFSTRIEINQQN